MDRVRFAFNSLLVLLRIALVIVLLLLSPIGWFWVFCLIAAAFGSKYGFNQAHGADVAIASVVFGTRYRTISGVIGERYHIDGKARYKFIVKLVDFLAYLCGDGEYHCLRAYNWEANNLPDVK